MKQILVSTTFFILSLNAFSQIEYAVDDFSDIYSAVFIMNENQKQQIFKKGTMLVVNKKTRKTVIELECESAIFETKVPVGSKKVKVSYNEQSSLLYTDFNFDGKDDIAIQQYYSSKGPAYTIFIAKDVDFELDPAFTELIQNSQGDWDLEPESKTIYTRSSGGCCWHSFSIYTIQNGKPVLVSESVEQIDFAFNITTTKQLKDGKMITAVEKTINLEQDGITVLMSFDLKDKNKRVILFNINDATLNYVLVSGEDQVEFNYPIETVHANPDFTLTNGSNDLLFKNENAEYKIYQTNVAGKITSVGIIVNVNEKTYDMKGDITTLSGNLKAIPKLNNVVMK